MFCWFVEIFMLYRSVFFPFSLSLSIVHLAVTVALQLIYGNNIIFYKHKNSVDCCQRFDCVLVMVSLCSLFCKWLFISFSAIATIGSFLFCAFGRDQLKFRFFAFVCLFRWFFILFITNVYNAREWNSNALDKIHVVVSHNESFQPHQSIQYAV